MPSWIGTRPGNRSKPQKKIQLNSWPGSQLVVQPRRAKENILLLVVRNQFHCSSVNKHDFYKS